MTARRVALSSALLVAMALPARASRPSETPLTSGEIMEVLKARAGAFQACYQKQLAKDPGLAAGGKLVVAFAIAGNGKVREVEVKQAYQRTVDACVKRELVKLVFPAKGYPTRVSYPIRFGS